jgi:hypothetical protein
MSLDDNNNNKLRQEKTEQKQSREAERHVQSWGGVCRTWSGMA